MSTSTSTTTRASRASKVNTTQAAEMLGVQTRTFKRICEREGITPIAYEGGAIFYKRSDVNRLIRLRAKAARTARPARSTANTNNSTPHPFHATPSMF